MLALSGSPVSFVLLVSPAPVELGAAWLLLAEVAPVLSVAWAKTLPAASKSRQQ